MSGKYLNDYLSVVAIDVAVEEKTRIARIAVATLHKLHNVMLQMKDWRDDSAKLKSNIWRMKMALRADDKNGNDNQQIDPLIAHQRTEISRLEQANDALENEVTSLKCALTKTEEDIMRITSSEIGDKIAILENEFLSERERMNDEILYLKERLKEVDESETSVMLKQLRDELNEFARGDRTIEIIFANAIGKTVEMIIGLSEELVNVSENLYRFKTRNRNLRLKLDRSRAMLRSRCGNSAEYQKRIGELNNLAEQLMGEMGRLKVIRENANYSESSDATDILDVVRHVERLMNDLRNNLKSDREAMIAAGDPDCLKYMKKVVNLKVNLKVLSVELRRSNVPIDKRLCENLQYEKCLETASSLNNFLQEIDNEIEKLKIKPMNKYCKIGGISSSQYMIKVTELEDIVRKSIAIIAILKQTKALPEVINTNEKITEILEDLIEQLCSKIKELEIFDDRANLRDRIEQLEAMLVYLKSELLEKNERINALNDEHASIGLTLKRDREKYEKIIADIREVNETLRRDVEKRKQEILELSLKHDHSERRVAEMQLMKVEIDAAKKELQNLHDDKEMLLGETERMRNVLEEKDEEIENIITQKNVLKAVLRAETEDLKTKLGIASDENVKLRSIIEGLGKQEERERLSKLKSSEKESGGKERDNGEDRAQNLRDESEYLKAESNEPKINLDKADKRIGYLKCASDEDIDDKAEPEDKISYLEPNEQSLTYRLNVLINTSEETSGEFNRVIAEYKASKNKVKQLQNEKEQLEEELSKLRSEKELLDRSMSDANNKCAVLQDQVNKFKSERNGLREKISEHEATAENLKFELERARTELEDAVVNTARLQSENSKAIGDLDTLSLRNTETEDRVRMLLTEKNEFATRINELNDENVALREQLNKASEENEYFSMKLNKSRVENDKAKAENALLQATYDAREKDNVELRKERDDAKERINEIANKCRALDNQLKIQRMKYEALRLTAATLHDENNDRKNYLKKIDMQHPFVTGCELGFATHNEIKQKQNCSDTARTSIKVEIGERRDGGTEVKVESDTRVGHKNKAVIKDESKSELERSKSENNSLKLEQANLKSKNSEVTLKLVKDRSENVVPVWIKVSDDDEISGSTLKKFENANIWHEKEISNYSNYFNNPDISKDSERTATFDIDQLEVENRALKMKADISCSSRNSCLMDDGKFARATDEIQALKLELMYLRDEKATLKSQFEIFREELNALKSEKMALKDELAASRKSNFDLRLTVNDLRSVNEKLKEINVGLENRSQDTSKRMNKCTTQISEVYDKKLKNNYETELSDYLKKYISTGKNLRITNRRNRFDRISPKNPGLQSVEENLQHIEGQKY